MPELYFKEKVMQSHCPQWGHNIFKHISLDLYPWGFTLYSTKNFKHTIINAKQLKTESEKEEYFLNWTGFISSLKFRVRRCKVQFERRGSGWPLPVCGLPRPSTPSVAIKSQCTKGCFCGNHLMALHYRKSKRISRWGLSRQNNDSNYQVTTNCCFSYSNGQVWWAGRKRGSPVPNAKTIKS